MSDLAVSALSGASAEGIVSVREMGLQGMITLKADLGATATGKAVKAVTKATMPAARGVAAGEGAEVAWMAPDELLILCDHSEAGAKTAALADKLKGQHHLAVNVSDARVVFELTGAPGALRDVLSKIMPADLSQDALQPGEMRRTRLAQVPAALWFVDAGTARIICFRSVAQYVFDVLRISAQTGGEVGYH